MILSVKVNLNSVEACKVDSGARGGEANREVNLTLSLPPSLPTPLYHTANIILFTHFTLNFTPVHHLNNQLDYVIRHFVLYLADKARNTKINTQQLNLLSWKRK